ncbi:hypothetical protein [Rhizobium binxianense]|uniref:hypothetical protein n=1 Tax=Rhizobium binxianense TaxID=3024242 RepID=UPI00235EB228|nr:hypothetical protein [Rhizobium sp. MJ37]MDC9836330.1 hypothetical protein [Rhizobium sp. MJ37]
MKKELEKPDFKTMSEANLQRYPINIQMFFCKKKTKWGYAGRIMAARSRTTSAAI